MPTRANTPTPQALRAAGTAVALRRQTLGMSQSSLGAAIGVSQAQISELEKGNRAHTLPGEMFAIEAALEVPAGSISFHLGYVPVGSAPPSTVAGIWADSELDEAQKNLMDAYHSFITS